MAVFARWGSAFFTLLLPLLHGCGTNTIEAPSSAAKPDIILISIDSLRPDHIGCYGYKRDTTPYIDQLAAEGVRFNNAMSTTSWTLPAHAALFTGLYDSAHGLVDKALKLADAHVTLAEVFRDAGYQTSGFYGGPFLHPTFGLHQGFMSYYSCMTTTADDADINAIRGSSHVASHHDITGPRTLERFGNWLATADDRPMFVFLHMWDVHYDYIPPKHYVDRFDPDYQGSVRAENFMWNQSITRDMPARDLEHVIALYDGEIRFTDDILKQILDKLDEAGRFERALIVVTADHGEEFFEHGGKGHMRTLFDELVRVPLIVRWPGQLSAGQVISDQVCLIDVMPTLLSLAGVSPPRQIQGRDLSPLLHGTNLPPVPALLELYFGKREAQALRTNEYKAYVHNRVPGFYDLSLDPGELHNRAVVAGQFNPKFQEAMTRIRSLIGQNQVVNEQGGLKAVRPSGLSEQMIQQLKSLGYIGDDDEEVPIQE